MNTRKFPSNPFPSVEILRHECWRLPDLLHTFQKHIDAIRNFLRIYLVHVSLQRANCFPII